MPLKGRTVRRLIHVQAAAEKVLDAFLRVDRLKRWWGVSAGLVEPRKGGVFSVAWGETTQGHAYLASGVIRSFIPHRRLRVESMVYWGIGYPPLGPMRLAVNLLERDGRTRVTIRQDGFGEGADWDRYYKAVSQGWKESLRNLKIFLEEEIPSATV